MEMEKSRRKNYKKMGGALPRSRRAAAIYTQHGHRISVVEISKKQGHLFSIALVTAGAAG
jgi:hypothetical protein